MPATPFEHAKLREMMVEYSIPPHCMDSLENFILEHQPVGSFLQSLLSNNLNGTYCNADTINYRLIDHYINFLHNCAPWICWGSPDRYKHWLSTRV